MSFKENKLLSIADSPWPLFCFKLLLALVFVSLITWGLLALAYCIPTSWMAGNLHSSAQILTDEDKYPSMHFIYNAPYDNATEMRMINIASFSGNHNPFIEALECNEYSGGMEDLLSRSEAIIDKNELDSPEYNSYTRYWHGYLLYLKPLLCVLNIGGIRQLFHLLFLCALAVLVAAFRKLKYPIASAIVLVISFTLFGGDAAASCLPFFPSMIIPIVSGIVILSFNHYDLRTVALTFAATGSLISIFDF